MLASSHLPFFGSYVKIKKCKRGDVMNLGWIDFSKTERSKVLSVLDLLQDGGTLDELGIAPIRDGFSSIFFLVHLRSRLVQSIF